MAKQKPREEEEKDAGAIAPIEQTPAWLAEYDGETGLDELSQFKIVPRLKIKQPSARDPYKSMIDGTVVISGTTQVVVQGGGPENPSDSFRVVPLFFFPEWITMSDLKDKQSPTILHRTTDQNDPIVAMSRDKQLRVEKYGENGQFKKSHREVFNFVCLIVGDNPLSGSIVVMTFSRAEHRTGRQWCTYLFMRKSPIFGQIFEFHTKMRPGDDGDWWGFNFQPVGWVSSEDFEEYKNAHLEFKRLHAAQQLRAAEDDDPDGGSADAGGVAEDAGV